MKTSRDNSIRRFTVKRKKSRELLEGEMEPEGFFKDGKYIRMGADGNHLADRAT